MNDKSNRHLAARLARQLEAGQISTEQFLADFPEDTGDDTIDELYDMIEHEPQLGGLFGVSESKYKSYKAEILLLILKLEK
jgi:hypothetical protein